MSDLSKYMDQIAQAFPAAQRSDVYSIGKSTFDAVGRFLTDHNAVRNGQYDQISVANESLSIDDAMTATGIEELSTLVKSCGVSEAYLKPCCEAVIAIMDRCLGHSTSAAWMEHNRKTDAVSNSKRDVRALNEIYASDTVAALTGSALPSAEAFGVNVDLAVPDLKVAISVAIMNFHTRLLPRILPTKATTQPNVSYVKDFLEVYDLVDVDGPRKRLVDLYEDPKFAANELQKIVPLMANEEDQGNPKFLVSNGVLKFGVKANILKLSLQEGKYGHTRINRTDLIAEGVKMESVMISLTSGATTEQFSVAVPTSVARLTRMVNADDSAMRNADIKFRVQLRKGAAMSNGTASTLLGTLADDESIVVEFNLKPTVSLKFGEVDCLGAVSIRARHDVDNANLSAAAKTLAGGTPALVGYVLDARFSEENLRKTSIAIWTHRQPFSYDIPIGRNYVYNYAIGQTNAEENATNLNKVIGIGQDDVALRTVLIRTIEDVADRLKAVGPNPEDQAEYVGKRYVAGDKVRPSIFQGTLDFTQLNIIRDSDRAGDIKTKALIYLNAVTTRLMAESFFLQQIGGAGVTFKVVTSPEVLGNIIGMPAIHDGLSKDDGRDIGDGVEYVLVLPNGVKLEIVTCTFNYMKEQIVMWPVIKNNAESELNFATNWDYGTMVAHYTPSGEEAHHRLFANIRELPIVTSPVAAIVSVAGLDIVTSIAENGVLRPVVEIDGNVSNSGTIVVSGSLQTTTADVTEGEGTQG